MDVLAVRITAALVLWLGTVCCGILPAVLITAIARRKSGALLVSSGYEPIGRSNGGEKNQKNWFISLMMCFGGGILLATCFIHLLPEVRLTFSKFSSPNETLFHNQNEDNSTSDRCPPTSGTGFPFAEFVMCCGFFVVYLLEELIHMFIDLSHRHRSKSDGRARSLPQKTTCHHQRSRAGSSTAPANVKPSLLPDRKISFGKSEPHCSDYGSTIQCRNPAHDDADDSRPTDFDEPPDCDVHIETVIECETQVGAQSLFRGVMIVAALSFHSLFEGLAIGVQESAAGVWELLFAVAIHKFVIAFAVGLEILSESGRVSSVALYVLVLSLGSPVGIMTAALTKLHVMPVVDAVMNALATGSILYIVFFEILAKERQSANRLSGHRQLFGVLAGFGLMVAIQLMVGHDSH